MMLLYNKMFITILVRGEIMEDFCLQSVQYLGKNDKISL